MIADDQRQREPIVQTRAAQKTVEPLERDIQLLSTDPFKPIGRLTAPPNGEF